MNREEALDVMNILRFGTFEEVINTREIVNEALDVAIEALKEKRPSGEWIIVDDCEKFIARCSVCGRILDSRMVKYYPFCRCGADMRKEGDMDG